MLELAEGVEAPKTTAATYVVTLALVHAFDRPPTGPALPEVRRTERR